ncbi:lipocalin-like domain-containing protein [Candidatus Macondimonas diazotrophica]|jgi:predicted secreted hydrolase|uniref:Carotenoid 1,2-hydratase n=1 Tax=Candidatus Macondimonas diazotrophica TaxID=2305248 RepID=A0A4Z0FDV5_9GAMM|nr:lipocalin-like domain-containing protein [Candidatus Macondimonas diazotrophica]NCU00607.1 carotenoid 1,2-hydratase [Candidatus Macondimonas diazotrophica]TFZ84185.1 carotenoid 1,2-hydratase [Candidatus Macondimonas diazotrophica]
MRRARAGLVLLLLGLILAAMWHRPSPPAAPGGQIDLNRAFVQATTGFERAEAPRTFRFPEDHGPHPDTASEWWYVTGHLRTAQGRRFGYELTFFRVALAPGMPTRSSAWATRQIYMAHLAVTDPEGQRFHAFERFNRAALDMAGATAAPLRIWLDDWTLAARPGADPARATPPLLLRAAEGPVALALELDARKPPVLQGEAGLSRKGPAPGDASYYYSLTRLATHGTLELNGERFAVEGESWMDREWGTSALGPERSGWDWFGLQLDDGSELMFCRIRRRDGAPNPFDYGLWVDPNGKSQLLAASDVRLRETSHWRSPHTGIRYPAGWALSLPARNLRLELRPILADQELNLAVRYWEGAVSARGEQNGRPITGQGYVELTGYGSAP